MKKIAVVLGLLFLTTMAFSADETIVDPEDISIKAGPTSPGEGLSLAWLEAYIFPKKLEGDNMISLGVRTVSPVKKVRATFDFAEKVLELGSSDGMNWSTALKLAENVVPGLHIVRYSIEGEHGSIQRTVEFSVEEDRTTPQPQAQDNPKGKNGWMLTVIASAAAFDGEKARTLAPGQGVFGLYKVPWYKVVFDDGKEGWVVAAAVKEPVNEFYDLGQSAYSKGDFLAAIDWFKNAVALNDDFAKAHLMLGKSYYQMAELTASYNSVKKALQLTERDIDAQVMATKLAQDFFRLAQQKYNAGRYNEALSSYQKVVALKPGSTPAWILIGRSYAKLGFPNESRDAWLRGLNESPRNRELLALLDMDERTGAVYAEAPKVAPVLADDSLAVLKNETTRKGTKIESALKSVITLTKSLGTPVTEKGWQVNRQGKNFLVQYVCEQGAGAIEAFQWQVDVDARRAVALNDNAKLLMNRW